MSVYQSCIFSTPRMDLYGSEQDVHVKIGTQQELNEQNKVHQ